MPLPIVSDRFELKKLSLAGYYALDVAWGDGHGSLFPFRDLRRRCPCEECRDRPADVEDDARARTPVEIAQETPFVRIVWEDDHVSRYKLDLLRGLCACAACAGEAGPVEMFLSGKPGSRST